MRFHFLTLLTLTTTGVDAFVPPQKLMMMRPTLLSASTIDPSATTTTNQPLNEEKFLTDMNQELSDLPASSNPIVSSAAAATDPTYIIEARNRIAALSDKAEDLKQQYKLEIQELRTKSVFDSFKTSQAVVVEEMKTKAQAKKTVEVVSTTTTTATTTTTTKVETTSSSGSNEVGWVGLTLAAAVVISALVVSLDPTSLSLGNLDMTLFHLPKIQELDIPKINVDIDWSSIQEQLQANLALVLVWIKEMQSVVQSQVAGIQLASVEAKTQFEGMMSSVDITLPQQMELLSMDQLDLSGKVQELQSTVSTQLASSQEIIAKATAQLESSVPKIELLSMDPLDLDLSGKVQQLQSTMSAQMESSQATIAQATAQLESSVTAKLQSDFVPLASNWKDAFTNAREGWLTSTQMLTANMQEQASNAFESTTSAWKDATMNVQNGWMTTAQSLVTTFQGQVSDALKVMDTDLKGVQETLATTTADWETTVPSVLTSAGEDLKALLRH